MTFWQRFIHWLIGTPLSRNKRQLSRLAKRLREAEQEAVEAEHTSRDLALYLARQKEWSAKTFGSSERRLGIVEHIGKELAEVVAARTAEESLEEWCDIAILALDGAWRSGFTPEQVWSQLCRKQRLNLHRRWPPIGPEDRAKEHIREAAEAAERSKG